MILYATFEEFEIYYNQSTSMFTGTIDGTPCLSASDSIDLNITMAKG